MADRGRYRDGGGEDWCAKILNPQSERDIVEIERLRKIDNVEIIDTIQAQLDEYIKLGRPGEQLSSESISQRRTQLLSESKISSVDNLGNWVFYPWAKKLVHLLPENLFIAVRTDRNRNKITTSEQEELTHKKIGVVGLSVGRSVASTLSLERVFGELRLADYDTLDLSNLNRLKAPVWDLGQRKTISAAREIAETDPYLNIQLFHDGLTRENIESFFEGNGKLDIIVDECDSIEVKLLLREVARKKGVPVLMETSDRGMLDIERFDLEPDRPIFHGLLKDFDIWEDIKSPELKWKMLMTLVDFDSLSEKARISLAQIGKSISTWPQLASSVVLGGGTVTDAARRILLGEPVESGRYYIDVQELTNGVKGGNQG